MARLRSHVLVPALVLCAALLALVPTAIAGGDLDQVTRGDDEGVEPAYSPNGAAIVFRRGRELFTMDADGSGTEQLADAPAGGSNIHPSWGR